MPKIAFKVMTTEGHEGKRYEMTGPEALTMADVAEILSQALGVQIRVLLRSDQ